MPKRKQGREEQGRDGAELVPKTDFEQALKKVLATTKEESDRQLATFQASNKARREERSHREAKPKG